jgi:hypothetical protein
MKNQDYIFEHSSMLSSTYIPSTEPFICLASFIDRIKYHFVTCYSSFDSIYWSQNDNNRWSGNNQAVLNYDLLTIGSHQLQMKFEIIRIEKENKLKIRFQIKMNDTTIVELPVGVWQENEIEKEFQ